ncbi:hypothetical protein ANN_09382 [Periplaneta americana]|uniref:Uncharacterized protein n=1 Tax=Periplaneta americana TaxID=6978 RepID=A0ABQ8TN82_PERAM|nr:hypothetical protein ANN_09382 [Periplaneta americana]
MLGLCIDIGNGEVKKLYRLGHGKNRPILVRLANRMNKEKIMDSKKALKDSRIRICADFEYEMRYRRKKTKRRKTEHRREAADPPALVLATEISLKASGKKKQLN